MVDATKKNEEPNGPELLFGLPFEYFAIATLKVSKLSFIIHPLLSPDHIPQHTHESFNLAAFFTQFNQRFAGVEKLHRLNSAYNPVTTQVNGQIRPWYPKKPERSWTKHADGYLHKDPSMRAEGPDQGISVRVKLPGSNTSTVMRLKNYKSSFTVASPSLKILPDEPIVVRLPSAQLVRTRLSSGDPKALLSLDITAAPAPLMTYGSPSGYPTVLPPGIALRENGMYYEVATGRMVYFAPPPVFAHSPPPPMVHPSHHNMGSWPGSVSFIPPQTFHPMASADYQQPMGGSHLFIAVQFRTAEYARRAIALALTLDADGERGVLFRSGGIGTIWVSLREARLEDIPRDARTGQGGQGGHGGQGGRGGQGSGSGRGRLELASARGRGIGRR